MWAWGEKIWACEGAVSLKRNEIILSNWKSMLLINDMILLLYLLSLSKGSTDLRLALHCLHHNLGQIHTLKLCPNNQDHGYVLVGRTNHMGFCVWCPYGGHTEDGTWLWHVEAGTQNLWGYPVRSGSRALVAVSATNAQVSAQNYKKSQINLK